MRRARRYLCLAVPLLALAAPAGSVARTGAVVRSAGRRSTLAPNHTFTLRSVDEKCFYAGGGTTRGWPWDGRGPFPIRGSFNEVRSRTGSHFGVDVSATRNGEDVHAIAAGVVRRRTGHTLTIADSPDHRWIYWHLRRNGWRKGMHVRTRQVLAGIEWNVWHVHISEWVRGCGYVDPRRPTGNFRNPADTQTPMIGPLSAKVADRRAFGRPPSISAPPPPDPARSLPLGHLHGTVDLRATAMVAGPPTPVSVVGGTAATPDLAVSAIRAWLTRRTRPHEHLEMRTIMDGSKLVSNPQLWHKWAWGTWRDNACLYGHGACSQTMVWHVGGRNGLDTRAYPDGRYLYCVEALTIDDVANTRCTDVTIAN